MNSWAASAHCVSSVDDCRQRCVLNPDCACFAVQPELLQTGQCGKRQLRRCAIYRGASEARRVTSNAAEYDAFALTPRVPRMLIQYGAARTATTLQFQIMCAAMFLLHQNTPQKVRCRFWSGLKPNDRILLPPAADSFEVVKTHVLPDNIAQLRRHAWLFATSVSAANGTNLSQELGMEVKLLQDYEMLRHHGYRVATKYQQILSLSKPQVDDLLEYLRYWVVLRQCCGMQMSAEWRARLVEGPTHRVRHSSNSSQYPACEIYDLDAVERAVMGTKIFSRFRAFSPILSSVSNLDSPFTGAYCTRVNEQVQRHRLRFNQAIPNGSRDGVEVDSQCNAECRRRKARFKLLLDRLLIEHADDWRPGRQRSVNSSTR